MVSPTVWYQSGRLMSKQERELLYFMGVVWQGWTMLLNASSGGTILSPDAAHQAWHKICNVQPPCLVLCLCCYCEMQMWVKGICFLVFVNGAPASEKKCFIYLPLPEYEQSKNYFLLDPLILFRKMFCSIYAPIPCLEHPYALMYLSLNIVPFFMIGHVLFFPWSLCLGKDGKGRKEGNKSHMTSGVRAFLFSTCGIAWRGTFAIAGDWTADFSSSSS